VNTDPQSLSSRCATARIEWRAATAQRRIEGGKQADEPAAGIANKARPDDERVADVQARHGRVGVVERAEEASAI
jgi:hypothetical protein